MHKIVNGIKIDLTPEEETATLAEWERNRLKNEQLKLEETLRSKKKLAVMEKLRNKLLMTEEEMSMIF